KESARDLHNTIASLGGLDEADLLSKKTAFSSDPDIASVNYVGSYTPGEENPSISLEVQELALPQENMGNFLPASKVGLSPDTYSFDVNINDMNYEFQFTLGDGETNRDLQERLARLINNSGIGLKARVQDATGRSSLVLESEATGLTSGKTELFRISDEHTSKARGAVNYLGIDYISRPASNARFTIDGEPGSTASNSFTYEKKYDISLHSITPEDHPVTIGLKTNVESLTDNVVQLTEGYNRFLLGANNYLDSQPRSRHVVREMGQIISLYQDSLKALGVNRQENGTLEVDRAKLSNTVIESEDVADTFHTLKDFSNLLLRKSSQISLNPMQYVDQIVVAYKNPVGHNYANPYVSSAYSGMIFNGYC
ncbi:MAG: hypothetical protein HDR02_12295, partial [Lachnospiraceae bacterium]|nr:hypothetical protein [Lachnospiraceae bacterium]